MSSRATESHIARRASVGGDFIALESFSGASSYTAGGNIYKSQVFKTLERVVEVGFSRNGLRYQVVTGSVTGNTFKVQFFVSTGSGTPGAFTGELGATTSLTSDSFWVIEEGT